MLTAFARAFRTPDLRRKLLFTMATMAIFRLGSFIPTPGISSTAVRTCVVQIDASSGAAGAFALANLFSGGALLQLSIFALGIMPYIPGYFTGPMIWLWNYAERVDRDAREG